MAGETKKDSKIFQIVMVLITSILAPILVYFITHALDARAQQARTPTALSAGQATAPADGQPSATPFGVVNPRGTLPLGTPGTVGSLAVWAEAGESRVDGDSLSLVLHVRNLSGQAQSLAFSPRSFVVRDSAGQALEPRLGDKSSACRKTDLDARRQVQVAPGQDVVLRSTDVSVPAAWCAQGATETLPLFALPGKGAQGSLQVSFSGLGPFNGFGLQVTP